LCVLPAVARASLISFSASRRRDKDLSRRAFQLGLRFTLFRSTFQVAAFSMYPWPSFTKYFLVVPFSATLSVS
jgi:hypothetical protein